VTFLAKVAEIPDGERKLIQVNGVSVAVFHQEGRFYALNNACPHRQGPLIRGALENWGEGAVCAIRCPMHGWKFDLATGDSHGRPGNATVYSLMQKGDELYIEI
jgi:nitrite reductase/ring-hydroxylating ferredoxin subunit